MTARAFLRHARPDIHAVASLVSLLVIAGCARHRELWERVPPSYAGAVTWTSMHADSTGPAGGPHGLYRLFVERRGGAPGPRQAAVFLDSATRVIDRGSREQFGRRGGYFVRVWFRGEPRATEIEIRGKADVVVIDSVVQRPAAGKAASTARTPR